MTSDSSRLPFRSVAIRVPLIAIRHGQTDWNAEGRLQGQRDIPLNDTGRAQAKQNGRALHSLIGDGEGWTFIGSPLIRTKETMQIVRGELDLDADAFATDERLMEASFGTWEGFTMDEMKASNRPAYRARKDDRWGYVPPGGESYAMVGERVADWLDTLSGPTVAVTHGGVLRVLRALAEGDADDIFSGPPPQDKIYVIENGEGRWV